MQEPAINPDQQVSLMRLVFFAQLIETENISAPLHCKLSPTYGAHYVISSSTQVA